MTYQKYSKKRQKGQPRWKYEEEQMEMWLRSQSQEESKQKLQGWLSSFLFFVILYIIYLLIFD